jgi:RNA polymerase sigma factor (TIGR02999 family)
LEKRDLTTELQAWEQGDAEAGERVFAVVYGELRRRAGAYLRRERPDHTLEPTALVHEAYLRLCRGGDVEWQSRAHFFAIAATVMRRILVDHARKRGAQRRGQVLRTVALDQVSVGAPQPDMDVVALDEALTRLAEVDERQSRIVELRYFGGLTVEETARLLEVSTPIVKREWTTARAWLHREIAR